jgi:hypothetical protein
VNNTKRPTKSVDEQYWTLTIRKILSYHFLSGRLFHLGARAFAVSLSGDHIMPWSLHTVVWR